MLPLPTPAMTMPSAPFFTLASIKSGDISAQAKTIFTCGNLVTFETSNSL